MILAACGATEEARLRKAQAMVGDGRHEEVIAIWEHMRADKDPLAQSEDWLSVATKAME